MKLIERMEAVLGRGRGPLPDKGPLHRSDRAALEAFLTLTPARSERLEVRAGGALGSISVLWLDGEPVAHAQHDRGAIYTKAFVGLMDKDEFAAAARQYLCECSGQHAFVNEDTDPGFTRACAADLGDLRYR